MSESNAASRDQVWSLVDRLLSSMVESIRQIDALAPGFPDELYEARDPESNMQVVDFIERLARHSLQHRHEVASVRASVGRSWPTDPGDSHPDTGAPYASTWYAWFLLEALLRRAELASELIGLEDEDLDRQPAEQHVAGNNRTIRQVCEHVLHVEQWLLNGARTGIETHRAEDVTDTGPE